MKKGEEEEKTSTKRVQERCGGLGRKHSTCLWWEGEINLSLMGYKPWVWRDRLRVVVGNGSVVGDFRVMRGAGGSRGLRSFLAKIDL